MTSPIARCGSPSRRPVVLVDLDGTLKTATSVDAGDLSVEVGASRWRFAKRPHVEEFLDAVAAVGRVMLCTAAGGAYAHRVLRALGIPDRFEAVFSEESFARGLPWFDRFILVEDDPDLGVQKIKCMVNGAPPSPWASDGEIRSRIVVVPKYLGGPDDSLLAAVQEVEAALRN